MLKLSLKIVILALAAFGLFNILKTFFPFFNQLISDPRIAQSSFVKGAVDSANQVLPEDQQLHLPQPESVTYNTEETITRTITQIITEKVAQTAESASDNLKQAAKDQVCQEIYSKVYEQCGKID